MRLDDNLQKATEMVFPSQSLAPLESMCNGGGITYKRGHPRECMAGISGDQLSFSTHLSFYEAMPSGVALLGTYQCVTLSHVHSTALYHIKRCCSDKYYIISYQKQRVTQWLPESGEARRALKKCNLSYSD